MDQTRQVIAASVCFALTDIENHKVNELIILVRDDYLKFQQS